MSDMTHNCIGNGCKFAGCENQFPLTRAIAEGVRNHGLRIERVDDPRDAMIAAVHAALDGHATSSTDAAERVRLALATLQRDAAMYRGGLHMMERERDEARALVRDLLSTEPLDRVAAKDRAAVAVKAWGG